MSRKLREACRKNFRHISSKSEPVVPNHDQKTVEACNKKFYDDKSRLSIPIVWPLNVGIDYLGPEHRIPRQTLSIQPAVNV